MHAVCVVYYTHAVCVVYYTHAVCVVYYTHAVCVVYYMHAVCVVYVPLGTSRSYVAQRSCTANFAWHAPCETHACSLRNQLVLTGLGKVFEVTVCIVVQSHVQPPGDHRTHRCIAPHSLQASSAYDGGDCAPSQQLAL